MGRMTRARKAAQKTKVADCIFPKGKKAGVRCSSLSIVTVGTKMIKVCGYSGCAYNEKPLY